jgi:hypothetical protein
MAFRQIFGIAMGTNLAPILANIYLAILEKEIKEDNKNDPLFKWPIFFKRFIDDILGIMDGSMEDVKYFIKVFNRYVSSIEVQPIKMGSEVDFMDLVIFKGTDFFNTLKLSCKTFQKANNIYDYIPFSSNHPKHVHSNLIISELNRYIKNSSKETYFLKTALLFIKRLRRRGYKRTFIKKHFALVDYKDRMKLIKMPDHSKQHYKILLSTMHRWLKPRRRVQSQAHLYNQAIMLQRRAKLQDPNQQLS